MEPVTGNPDTVKAKAWSGKQMDVFEEWQEGQCGH